MTARRNPALALVRMKSRNNIHDRADIRQMSALTRDGVAGAMGMHIAICCSANAAKRRFRPLALLD
jgi:hypothetical protein